MNALPTITTAAQQIQDRQLAPSELLNHCLTQIKQHDHTIKAWTHIDEENVQQQARHSDKLATQKQLLGPLHGIPIGIKDIIDVKDLPTQAGSPLRTNHRADHDATVVTRLREAGAIILGKTVTCQFACFDPAPTRNPWNLAHTPGGSSAGSAAAIAAAMCPGTIGSQTGGSIIRPASYCGVVGFKPTFNTIPTDGVFPVSKHLDHVGPFALSVPDVQLLFSVLNQNLEFGIRKSEIEPLPQNSDFGIRNSEFETLLPIEQFFEEATPPVQSATREAVQQLGPHLSNATTFHLPASYNQVHTMHRRIMAKGAATVHLQQYQSDPTSYSPNISALIEEGLAIPTHDYEEALQHQQQFQQDMDQAFPPDTFLITPATNTPAPDNLNTTGDPRFNSPWSYAGLPTLSIPCGLTPEGLPVALQLIAPRHQDHALLTFAANQWPDPFPLAG